MLPVRGYPERETKDAPGFGHASPVVAAGVERGA
jgi:hypothetical protein